MGGRGFERCRVCIILVLILLVGLGWEIDVLRRVRGNIVRRVGLVV